MSSGRALDPVRASYSEYIIEGLSRVLNVAAYTLCCLAGGQGQYGSEQDGESDHFLRPSFACEAYVILWRL